MLDFNWGRKVWLISANSRIRGNEIKYETINFGPVCADVQFILHNSINSYVTKDIKLTDTDTKSVCRQFLSTRWDPNTYRRKSYWNIKW